MLLGKEKKGGGGVLREGEGIYINRPKVPQQEVVLL